MKQNLINLNVWFVMNNVINNIKNINLIMIIMDKIINFFNVNISYVIIVWKKCKKLKKLYNAHWNVKMDCLIKIKIKLPYK